MTRTRKPPPTWDPKTDPLPEPRHEKFCVAYAKGLPNKTIKQAAIEAGYPEKTASNAGYKLLRIDSVNDRIRGLLQAAAEAAVMDINERRLMLTKIARGKLSDQFEALDRDGGKHLLRSRLLKTRIDAMQELNKLDGSYAPDKMTLLGGGVFEVVVKDQKGNEVLIKGDE